MSLIKNMVGFKNWYMFYAGRFGFLKKDIEMIHRSGVRIRLRPNTDDLRIVKSNFIKKNYTRDFVPIRKDSIVVDVGAHIGSFSVMIARNMHKVLAFEPEPNNYQMLKKNRDLNHLGNMSIFQMAVSGVSGCQDMFTHQTGSTADYSLYKRESTHMKIGCVSIISLKDIMMKENLPQIDFLKMDCEGAEHDILRKIDFETASKIMGIAMEVHHVSPEFSINLPVRLIELGYEVKVEQGGGYIYAKRIKV
jgi:FkbM family methyltransferase